MTRLRSLAPVLFLTVACGGSASSIRLDPQAERVQTGRGAPPPGFVEVGRVAGEHGVGCGSLGRQGNYADAEADLRNKAGAMGASYVRIDRVVKPHQEGKCWKQTVHVQGTAFRSP